MNCVCFINYQWVFLKISVIEIKNIKKKMRVFILCTGRSGSTTIIKACKHIENYTSGHEMLANKIGSKRFNYPDNHIEADNRLSWSLGELNDLFGDEAFYVHLKRNRDKVAKSFFKRFYYQGSIIEAFSTGIKMIPSEQLTKNEKLKICYDYVDTVNANIELFLSDKTKVLTLNLENIESDFRVFWKHINAQGNIENAMKELKNKHNASNKRKPKYAKRLKSIIKKEFKYFEEAISK